MYILLARTLQALSDPYCQSTCLCVCLCVCLPANVMLNHDWGVCVQ